MKWFRFASAPLILPAVLACAPPSVAVLHTIPPKLNIVPAKSLAVVGTADQPPYDDEDDFLNLLITKLRQRGIYDVKDERAMVRGGADLRQYLGQSGGEVVLLVEAPTDNCTMQEYRDDDDETSWGSECNAAVTLIRPRTGEEIGREKVSGTGLDSDHWTAWNDGMNDAASQIIDSFTPGSTAELVDIDRDAPLAAEGAAKLDKDDYPGARALWEHALAATPASAPLLYNLGALTEAMKDWDAAGAYYQKAAALAPAVQRYQDALADFQHRRADAAEAVTDPAVKKAALEKIEQAKRDAAKARAAELAKTAITTPEGLSFVLLPAGTFVMGCTDGDAACGDAEKPAHEVTIDKPFYLAFTPTTNFQYQKCVEAGACHGTADPAKRLEPVVDVSWDDARDFCAWAGGRLPTEAEWEYAARGGVEGWRFPWGNEAGHDNANFEDNGGRNIEFVSMGLEPNPGVAKLFGLTYPYGGASPVATFEKNGFGLYDMVGNVAQWTADASADGARRALRGGSWAATANGGRVSIRYFAPPETKLATIGFRCAR